MADRLALLELAALDLEGAALAAEGTGSPALGTGLLLAQGVGLLFEEGLQSALGEPGGGGAGDWLHGSEIDVEPGAVVAEGAAGNDFAPLGGEAAEFLQFLRGERAVCHDASCVGVKSRKRDGVTPIKVRPQA